MIKPTIRLEVTDNDIVDNEHMNHQSTSTSSSSDINNDYLVVDRKTKIITPIRRFAKTINTLERAMQSI